jgi:hypothetical protein
MAERASNRPRRVADPVAHSRLLTLLHYAGWRLRVEQGEDVAIHATRDGVVVTVRAATLAAAGGLTFARAMRSSRRVRPSVPDGVRTT